MRKLVMVTMRPVHVNEGWRYLVWSADNSAADVPGLNPSGYESRDLAVQAAEAAGYAVATRVVTPDGRVRYEAPKSEKKCRHDFRDGDVCSKCDAIRGAA